MTTFDFSGKTVFVAGGTSGINLGIAAGFAKAGARVAVASRSEERVKEAVAALEAHGGAVAGHVMDVRKPETVEAALKATHEAYGAIDVLVSGAAGNFLAAANEMSPNAFRTVVDIDLNGTFNVSRLAWPYLRKPGASVINISAPQSTNPTPLQAHACAAKAGIDILTRVMAMEWGPEGVRVNAIVPGPIAGTEGIKRLAGSESASKAMIAQTPLGRMGEVEDVANMALFLSTDLASYVTGAIVPVDGGRTLSGAGAYRQA